MSLPALYELASSHRQLLKLLESDDVDELTEEAIRNTLEGLEGDIALKSQSCAAVVLNAEAMVTMTQDAGKKLLARAERLQRRASCLRAYILTQLLALPEDKRKFEGSQLTVSVRRNPAAVIVTDVSVIPPTLMRQAPQPPPAPDKAKIKENLEALEQRLLPFLEQLAGAPLTPEEDKRVREDMAGIRQVFGVPGCHLERGFSLSIKS